MASVEVGEGYICRFCLCCCVSFGGYADDTDEADERGFYT